MTTPDSTTVTLADVGDGVRVVTLDDPSRRNAMGEAMGAGLRAAVARVRDDDDARVLVVTGAGGAFCAGADLPALFGDADAPVAAVHERLGRYYRAFLDVHELAIPTVAAVDGPAVGAGLNLALACDLRLASPTAVFGATFTRIGLHPGGGCTWFLVRALGRARAVRTLLLGESFDADEAVRLGLAEGPHDDVAGAAVELAGRLARVEPGLARHVLAAVDVAVRTDDLGATLAYETWAQAASASSDTLREWVARFR